MPISSSDSTADITKVIENTISSGLSAVSDGFVQNEEKPLNLAIVQSDKIEHPSVSITGGQGISVGVRVELPGERNTTHGVQVPAGEQSVQDIGRIVSAVATQVDFEELASDQEENILSLVSDVEISGDSGQDKNIPGACALGNNSITVETHYSFRRIPINLIGKCFPIFQINNLLR